MPIIRYGEPLNVLIAAKGHPYPRDPFMAMFDEMEGVACTLVEQPAAALLMNPEGMKGFDALVLYDMPGLDFRSADPPGYVEPGAEVKAGLRALLRSGKGIVALHHAIAGWPAWPDYGGWLGGRFLYRPGQVNDVDRLDSGYRHDVAYEAVALASAHPVLNGIPDRFPMTDELYLYEVLPEGATPLLRADHPFLPDGFYSSQRAVQGRMFSNEDWPHAEGSPLIGWVKRALNSPLVYLQPGDGPPTYENPHYRRLVENAVRWVASSEALAWAKAGDTP